MDSLMAHMDPLNFTKYWSLLNFEIGNGRDIG
jgi:hypothetical protein